ncbi:hypothetical protein PG993_008246 [Apiospora rasikravindrae]|uniref:Uncharacterized protein n=1 Tax=Apiospora rasikravindrae TaxID=990691 RepID=A0ABR1SZT5_9PEZI
MRVSLAVLSVFVGFLQLAVGALVTASGSAPASVSASATASLVNAMALPSVSTTLTNILTAPSRPTGAPNETPHSFSIVGMSALYGSGSVSASEPTAPATVSENAGQKTGALSHRWLYAGFMESLATKCAESIALLHLLHSVPVQPHANKPSQLPAFKDGYTLSFEQERHLAGVLAFLSSTKKDPNRIPAVCLREKRKPASLDVLLAVNKGDKDDGDDVLGELEAGFKSLFEILSRVGKVDAAHIEREAFDAIVSMCSARILDRLRFKAGSQRQSAKKLLEDVLFSLRTFRRIPVENLRPILASKIQKLVSEKGKPYPPDDICRLLKVKEPDANRMYAEKTRRTLKEGKVHAEIQLLFHCEQENFKFPPRVVCSSKDACFLCNTFILMHGKMHTPRSHGKLYPGWRLPNMGSTKLHSRFVQQLDNLTRGSLDTLLLRGTKTFYHDPNESTIFTLPVSTTTLCSQGTHHSALQINEDNAPQQLQLETVEELAAGPSPLESPGTSTAGSLHEGKLATIVEEVEVVKSPEMKKGYPSNASPISSLSELLSNITVEDDGQTPSNVPLPETVGANRTSHFYSDGVLEVFVEYSADITVPSASSKQLPFSVEWLDAEQAERTREVEAQHIFDAGIVDVETSLSLNDQNSVYILAKGSLVKLTFGLPHGG